MNFELWLFTLGNLFQLLGNLILIFRLLKSKSTFGLSLETQIILLIALVSRFIWIYDTRLTSFHLAYFELLLNIAASSYICYTCYTRREVANPKTPFYMRAWFITVICVLACMYFNPGVKSALFFTIQMLASFSMFMESLGLLPQIYLLMQLNEVENLTSHYIIAVAFARLIRFGFWFLLWLRHESFFHLVVADLLHTALLSNFVLLYVRSWRSGKPILLR